MRRAQHHVWSAACVIFGEGGWTGLGSVTSLVAAAMRSPFSTVCAIAWSIANEPAKASGGGCRCCREQPRFQWWPPAACRDLLPVAPGREMLAVGPVFAEPFGRQV